MSQQTELRMDNRFPPNFDLDSLPADEQLKARYIQDNLSSLRGVVEEFDHTLNLFETASHEAYKDPQPPRTDDSGEAVRAYYDEQRRREKERAPFHTWMHIAARNGAVILYRFWMITQKIHALLSNCPTVRDKMDTEAKRRATDAFKSIFGNVGPLRHSAAHVEEMSGTPDDFDGNALAGEEGGGGQIYIQGFITMTEDGVLFTSTVLNKEWSYSLSAKSLAALQKIQRDWWETFLPLESESAARHRQQLQEILKQNEPPGLK